MSPASSEVFLLDGLAVGYDGPGRAPVVVSEQIDTALHVGELVCLIGPNGAGKSTLLRTLAGMQRPLAGRALLDGRDIHEIPSKERARRLAVVLTDRVSAGLLTGREVVALGRYPHTGWSGRLSADDRGIVARALVDAGADELADRPISNLSDGERQRVMLARALAQEPAILLLDEITAFLDLPRRVETMRLLRALAHDGCRGLLMSTHDLELALRTADRIWLQPRGGRLRTGTPESLVLDGTFQEVFEAEGIRFDPLTGSFRLHEAHRGAIALAGTGVEAIWTRRTLQRIGLDVQDYEQSGAAAKMPLLRVAPEGESGQPVWYLRIHGAEHRLSNLEEVVAAARSIHEAAPSPSESPRGSRP